MIFHHFATFHTSGVARAYNCHVLPDGLALATPPAMLYSPQGDDPATLYHLPMDDMEEHWIRIHAEWHIYCDTATRHLGHGDIGRTRHAGGTPHPTIAHVQLGGTLSHSAAPHPRVAEHMNWIAGLTPRQKVLYFCGPHALGQVTTLPSGVSTLVPPSVPLTAPVYRLLARHGLQPEIVTPRIIA